MINRRDFLRTSVSGAALAGLLPRVSFAEMRLHPGSVRWGSGIEPLVKLIEDTPKDKLVEEIASRIKKGLAYNEVLAGLFVAAVRNVQPRPVGFKFHAVLAINAAHQASLSGPDSDRWLPILWSLDNFKNSQAEEKKKTGWTLTAIDESKVPPADKARKAFVDAVENWDVEGIDGPVTSLARSAGAHEVFELFFRYGMRDFRDLGHKAIYVAGAYRLLGVIGWQHAEPILRSLALALQYYTGDSPAHRDLDPDRPWKFNKTIVGQLPPAWTDGKLDGAATADLLTVCRTADSEAMSKKVADMLKSGISARSVWDAVLPAGGEIVMRRTNILSIHALTTFNALRYIYETSANDETRRLALLQAAAFVPLFRGKLDKEVKLDQVEPQSATLEDLFTDVSKDKMSASRKVLGYLKDGGDAKSLIEEARRLIFMKGMDAHDWKFSSAVLEDYSHLSPGWRDRFLAASVHYLKGSQGPDNGLVQRVRAALKG
ncbi:MAG: hypothetical protein HY293_11610 [Planctomycetes bacterium]|nr:hypothetical protein [Planctomycetota bacterium]